MPRHRRMKLYQFVADLREVGGATLADGIAVTPEQASEAAATGRLALTPEQAASLMLDVAKAFCWRNAKAMVYIPEAANLQLMDRDAAIWAAYQQDSRTARRFTPERIDELAAEHDLTTQMVYRIVAAQRAAELADHQPDLPGIPAAD